MGETMHEGGCDCGEVRYRLTGTPIFTNNCHCTQCQRQTGGTSVVNAFYEAERIEVLAGTPSEYAATAGSGGPHILCRCPTCGSALFSHYPRLGRLLAGVRVGTLDDSAWARPDAVVWIRDRMPWVTLPEGIPAFEEYYDFRDVLAPAQIERLRALVARRKAGEG